MKSLGKRADGARLERMKASPLWAGDRFQNVHPILPNLRDPSAPMPSITDFICGGERRVPSGPLPAQNPPDEWTRKPQSGLRVTWLGHSTMLMEIDGVRVLTDPVWGPRASPSTLVGPKRFQPVPVSLRQMPPVDVVVISHDHYDHLDYPTLRVGQPVEPAHAERVKPWWRQVENASIPPANPTDGVITLSAAAPWPLD